MRAAPRRSRGPSTSGDEQRRDAHADVERAQLARRWRARLAPVAPAVIEAIAMARPVMPTRACRCAGAWRCRSPIAVVKLTHCARLSTIQIASTSQKAVETARASTERPLTTMPVTITAAGARAALEPEDHRPGGDADQRADAEHPADLLAVEVDDVAQERHDQRLRAVEREVPAQRRERDAPHDGRVADDVDALAHRLAQARRCSGVGGRSGLRIAMRTAVASANAAALHRDRAARADRLDQLAAERRAGSPCRSPRRSRAGPGRGRTAPGRRSARSRRTRLRRRTCARCRRRTRRPARATPASSP